MKNFIIKAFLQVHVFLKKRYRILSKDHQVHGNMLEVSIRKITIIK